MPELPEVETICNGIRPHIQHKMIREVIVRESQLRWKIPADFAALITELTVDSVSRRGKYCLLKTASGSIILHLGMSGSLRIVNLQTPVTAHDHVDFVFNDNTVLRFNDPRKFGAVLWGEGDVYTHKLLINLGPEPLTVDFTGDYLYQRAAKRRKAIKNFIMDGHIVVGVGNIYASESLFSAGIHPTCPAGQVSLADYQKLVSVIKDVLQRAIEQGGTTLKDFVNESGNPGYFSQSLLVYGRAGQPCYQCQTLIEQITLAQRASYFCPNCQPALVSH
ncbi:MAG: bifunctional DNA-formamidopyrimidine glycosylase/DNA-(apurinic or apyrimidinic site) lyase [Methylococcales bacterium]|nr:bifunctional DNA-formamidopyrimidine glycosylase/DNA-(apurinic or apyrimidinic site) lyase [Methylococcales bacterium]